MLLLNRFKSAYHAFKNYGHSLTDEDFWRPLLTNTSKGRMSEVTYFTCLKTLGESVAKLPLKLYKNTGNGVERATDMNIYNSMKLRPNRNMTSTTFWSTVEMIKHHYGNAYVYPYYATPLSAPELFILDNNHMQIYVDNARIISKSGQVWYFYSEPTTGELYKIPESDILHFKTTVSFDGFTGVSVREMLGATLDGLTDSQRFVNGMYKNGLTGKVAVEYTQDLNDTNRRKLVSTVESAIDADKSINFIPIPWGVKLSPLNLKLTDAQFLEIRKYTALQIAAAFGIKPNQLNDYEKSSYSNSEHQQQAFLTETLLVNLKNDEEELTTKLLSEEQVKNGYFFKFNTDAMLRATYTERMEGYNKARQNGWMSANDICRMEDMPLIPKEQGGDAYLVNGNMIPMAQAAKGGGKDEN